MTEKKKYLLKYLIFFLKTTRLANRLNNQTYHLVDWIGQMCLSVKP